jgi:hypothetical protein
MKYFQQLKLFKDKTKQRNFSINYRSVATDTVSGKYVTLRYITLLVTQRPKISLATTTSTIVSSKATEVKQSIAVSLRL